MYVSHFARVHLFIFNLKAKPFAYFIPSFLLFLSFSLKKFGGFDKKQYLCTRKTANSLRRDARVAEEARLESV